MFIKFTNVSLIIQTSFNTSHVNVYLVSSFSVLIIAGSFNTSYVNVYLIQEAQNVFCCVRFNTSYVNVYQDKEVCVLEPSCGFQYILC